MLARIFPSRIGGPLVLAGCVVLALGCGGKQAEKPAEAGGPLIDIKTPIGDVTVDKDPETGRAQVDVDAGGVNVDVGSGEVTVDIDSGE